MCSCSNAATSSASAAFTASLSVRDFGRTPHRDLRTRRSDLARTGTSTRYSGVKNCQTKTAQRVTDVNAELSHPSALERFTVSSLAGSTRSLGWPIVCSPLRNGRQWLNGYSAGPRFARNVSRRLRDREMRCGLSFGGERRVVGTCHGHAYVCAHDDLQNGSGGVGAVKPWDIGGSCSDSAGRSGDHSRRAG